MGGWLLCSGTGVSGTGVSGTGVAVWVGLVVVVSCTELWVVTGGGVLVGVSTGSVEQRVVVVRVRVLVRVTGMVVVWVPEVISEEVTRIIALDRFY